MPTTRVNDDPSPVRTVLAAGVVVLFVGLLWSVWHGPLDEFLPEPATRMLLTVVLLGAVISAVRVVGDAILVFERRGLATPHQIEAAYRFLQMVSYGGVLVVSIVHVWEVSVANVLLGAGVTSVVLALAARQTLTSVFAGVSLFSTDVFRVGDWVKINGSIRPDRADHAVQHDVAESTGRDPRHPERRGHQTRHHEPRQGPVS
ncbi:mechanosensitive ion channel family protein [Halococcoides cellulosivorans]|nr:mechanosensitive ion channel family protein [Halococcoides cellulosivorans]